MSKFLKLFVIPVLIGGVVGVLFNHVAHSQTRSLEDLQKSTVSLKMSNGGSCSGWVLKDHQAVVTAAHCIVDDPTGVVKVDFHDGTGDHDFHVAKMGTVEGDKPDLAVLTTDDGKVKWPVGLPICHFKPYYLEQLFLFGDPLGFTKAITMGRVSNPSQVVGDIRQAPYIQYDGSLSPGNSGGAAVDVKEQCVMGSGEATIQSMAGDPVRFLEPASRLIELLQ